MKRNTSRRAGLAAAAVATALTLSACGSDSKPAEGSAASTAATQAPAATNPPVAATTPAPAAETSVAPAAETSAAPAAETTAAPAATGTVDANTASVEELAAAFEAAGVPNAQRWAREVEEYRPYDTADTSFTALRKELDKYGISDDTFATLISVLSLG